MPSTNMVLALGSTVFRVIAVPSSVGDCSPASLGAALTIGLDVEVLGGGCDGGAYCCNA